MSLLQAILLGLVQGLTEFLPVSSSGHLAIFQYIFGINTDTGMLFEVMLHLGTLIAVCAVFFKDIKQLVVEGIAILKDFIENVKIRFGRSNGKKRRIVTNAYRKFVLLILYNDSNRNSWDCLKQFYGQSNVLSLDSRDVSCYQCDHFACCRVTSGRKEESKKSFL